MNCSDEAKLFVGGISWDTTEDVLRDHFGKYGEIAHTSVMRDKITGHPRGFGFVVFFDHSVVGSVLQDQHSINGRAVEAKRAFSREQQQNLKPVNRNAGGNYGQERNSRMKRIFVGGLPPTLTEDEFAQYFQVYGNVNDVVIMFDQNTSRPRGFGFITFESEDAVDRVLHKNFHELKDKFVEVKRALPKDACPSASTRGVVYEDFGPSGANTRTYDSRMDGNTFLQAQTPFGGFPQYYSCGAPSYGYGVASSSALFGSYGGYGVGLYGGAGAAFGGLAQAYGNPGISGTGYMSLPGAIKNQLSSQAPGFVPSSYESNTEQAPIGSFQYGNEGYGFRNHDGSKGSYFGKYGTASGHSGIFWNSDAASWMYAAGQQNSEVGFTSNNGLTNGAAEHSEAKKTSGS